MHMVLYKKVEGVQFLLDENEIAKLKEGQPVLFMGERVRWCGGDNYMVVIQSGQDLIRIIDRQWVITHPEGTYQILYDFQVEANFIKAPAEEVVNIAIDPFTAKSFIQPTVAL